jgi:hypothetical protein
MKFVPSSRLGPRELRIVQLLADGMKNPLDVNECPVIQPKTNPAIAVVKRHNLYESRIYFSSVAEHHHHNSDMLTPPLMVTASAMVRQ